MSVKLEHATLAVVFIGVSSGAAFGQGAPISVDSCGYTIELTEPVSAALTIDQASTETALGLGAAPRLVGTAYNVTSVAEQYRAAWESVPYLSKDRLTAEMVRAAAPDLVLAFATNQFTEQWIGTRTELHELGVPTYISAVWCPEQNASGLSPFDLLALDYRNYGKLFGTEAEAEAVVAAQEAAIEAAREVKIAADEPVRVVWLYSVYNGTPYVGGGTSIPSAISKLVGVENVFDDVNEQWPGVSWEAIAEREPDVIVLGDLSERGAPGDTAAEKIEMFRAEPGVSLLDAVTQEQFIVVPGIELDPTIRSVNTLNLFIEGLQRLGHAE